MRDRIRLGLGGLKAFGEVWGTSRRTEREAKRIARAVFEVWRTGQGLGGTEPEIEVVNGVEPVKLVEPVEPVSFYGGGVDMGWQDLRETEYLAMLDGLGQQGLSGIST